VRGYLRSCDQSGCVVSKVHGLNCSDDQVRSPLFSKSLVQRTSLHTDHRVMASCSRIGNSLPTSHMLILAVLPYEVEANHINEKLMWRILRCLPFGSLASANNHINEKLMWQILRCLPFGSLASANNHPTSTSQKTHNWLSPTMADPPGQSDRYVFPSSILLRYD
jgi:hypothetical protein